MPQNPHFIAGLDGKEARPHWVCPRPRRGAFGEKLSRPSRRRRASPTESRALGSTRRRSCSRSQLRAPAEPAGFQGESRPGAAASGRGREREREPAALWGRSGAGGWSCCGDGLQTLGGRRDPPLSTRTVAEASADAFAPGRGGRTVVAWRRLQKERGA